MSLRRTLLFASAILLLGGLLLYRLTLRARPPGLNLILISLDTLRADRLGSYGYQRPTSPALDRFAEEAVIFENAVSPTSWTLPAHLSLFTGLYPTHHGVTRRRINGRVQRLSSEIPLLAEVLQGHGYRTFAFTGGGNVGKRFGFDRGFEVYIQDEDRPVRQLHGFAKSLSFAQRTLLELSPDDRFFLFLHTYDLHCPYPAREPHLSAFLRDNSRAPGEYSCEQSYREGNRLSSAEMSYLSDRYDAGIRSVDELLESFIQFLKRQNLLDSSIIVVTSDHGEELGEHGSIGHQKSLHTQLLMVPLLIRSPELAPQRISGAVNLVDVYPTLLDLLKLPPSVMHLDGQSLVSPRQGVLSSARLAEFSELDRGIRLRSLIRPRKDHFILDPDSQRSWYYDLIHDPAELHSKGLLPPANELELEISKMLRALQPRTTEVGEKETDEQLRRLRTLGYL